MTRLGVIFGIVFDLFALGTSKANDSAYFAAIYKGNVIKIVPFAAAAMGTANRHAATARIIFTTPVFMIAPW